LQSEDDRGHLNGLWTSAYSTDEALFFHHLITIQMISLMTADEFFAIGAEKPWKKLRGSLMPKEYN
jgi:hypothetical protein